MINKHKAPKKQPMRYDSFATNVRIKGWAVVLCKMPYETEHGDPEILQGIIGDALEFYFKHKQQESAKKNADEKKDVANAKI